MDGKGLELVVIAYAKSTSWARVAQGLVDVIEIMLVATFEASSEEIEMPYEVDVPDSIEASTQL